VTGRACYAASSAVACRSPRRRSISQPLCSIGALLASEESELAGKTRSELIGGAHQPFSWEAAALRRSRAARNILTAERALGGLGDHLIDALGHKDEGALAATLGGLVAAEGSWPPVTAKRRRGGCDA
jgi:hypothetical protein